MSLKKVILSLCLTSATAYANQALIKEFDTSKDIAQTLNTPSSSALQIEAFDQKTKHKKNTPAATTTKTNNHTEDIAKQTNKNVQEVNEKSNTTLQVKDPKPQIHNAISHPPKTDPIPTPQTTNITTTPTALHTKIPNFSTDYPAPMPLTAAQVPQIIKTTAENLLGNNITWVQNQCQYKAKIKGGYKNQSNAITLTLTKADPHYQNTITLSMNSSAANSGYGGDTFVKIDADKLKQLAQGISSPTKQGEFKKLFSAHSNNSPFPPLTNLSSTPESKELGESEMPQNVKSVGEELLGQHIVWEQNNCQYIAKIKGTNEDYTNVIKVPLYPNNPVYQGFLVSVTKTQGNNTNESENQNYTSKAKLQSLAQGISSPQMQAELVKLSKTKNT